MKRSKSNWMVLLAAGICLFSQAYAADLTGSYAWKPLKIGGGGWVTGMWIHPNTAGVKYCRTDVSGAYRWDIATSTWKQVVTSSSMPVSYVTAGMYGGVDSLVGAPNNANIAYMAYRGQIFKSTNQGDTWTATNFGVNNVVMNANGASRTQGERLGVDPNNSNLLIYCPINDTPWESQNGGAGWYKIGGIPMGLANNGATSVKFDPAGGTTGGKTNVIYVTVAGGGVFKTTDTGLTWTAISHVAGGPWNSTSPIDSCLGPDGTFYIACSNDLGYTGYVFKYSGGAWTNITPPVYNKNWQAIAVDPTNANRLTVMLAGGKSYTSTDQGATWTSQASWQLTTNPSNPVSWLGSQTNYWLSVGQLYYDPFSAGRLWFAEGFGVWTTTDIADTQITWSERAAGIEEMCGNDVIAPPGGKPVTAMWDIGAFYHNNPDAYNATRRYSSFMSGWSLDWSGGTPSFVAGVFHDHLEIGVPSDVTGYSTNGGLTWTVFPAVANSTKPATLKYGSIAVSATNTSRIVWCAPDTTLPYYTTNLGTNWTQGSFGGPTNTNYGGTSGGHTAAMKPLAADRVSADTFYFYLRSDGIYKSTNGGANWSRVGNNPVNNRYNGVLKAAPGNAGHLWFAEGQQTPAANGLWRSTNGGTTWTSVTGIDKAYNVGFGKALTGGSGYPAIYVAGVAGGVNGVFRSTDSGATWDKVCAFPLGIYDFVDAMDGDKDTFGKVYIGFSGAGFAYGAPTP